MKQTTLARRLFIWLLQTFVFIVLPLAVFYTGLSHIDQLRSEDRLLLIEQKVEESLAEFATQVNTEEFMVRSFYRTFLATLKERSDKAIKACHKQLGKNFDYLLWHGNRLVATSVDPASFTGNWRLAVSSIQKLSNRKLKDEATDQELSNLRRIFGPQLMESAIYENLSENNLQLMSTDSSGKKPRCWIASLQDITLITLVKSAATSASDTGLHHYLKYRHRNNDEFILGFVRKNHLVASGKLFDAHLARPILQQHSLKNGLVLNTSQAHYFMRIIEKDLTLFASISKKTLSAERNAVPATLMLALLTAPFVYLSISSLLRGENLRLAISRKLILLFVYSSGLPLSMLFFIGYDYLAQKQFAMFDEIHSQGTSFLKNFDERFKSEEALHVFHIKKALERIKKVYSQQAISAQPFKVFADELTEDLEDRRDLRLFMVASAAEFMGTIGAVYINKKRIPITTEKISARARKKKDQEAEAFTALLKFIISTFNGDSIDAKTATEIEMIAESVMQKSLLEVQNEFLSANGRVSLMGLGTSISRAFIELVSIYNLKKYDFMLMTIWDQDTLEALYINRQFLNASRNIDNLQLGMINEETSRYFPKELVQNKVLRDYVRRFRHRPLPPRQFIRLNHQDYLVMGFSAKYLRNYNLFGLYPARLIRDKIYQEKSRLISFGFASLVLAMILGQLLSYSFIFPLRILAEGAEAIQQRDFSRRLPYLGRDEFGEMAEVFNTTMVDLEELKVAGAVQEHLFPRQLPERPEFRIHAQSFSRGDLGGDYYDCFISGDDDLCLLSGDVSGHGAGAALIMAMAKAAIMKLENLHASPAELLLQIHQLIALAGRRQRQTMAFQFFSLNLTTKKAIYSNAGSWPPLIVDPKQGTASEITLPGPRLGALKKPRFSESEIVFQPEEALLLYTDGLVKAYSTADSRHGLEKLKAAAIACYDSDPDKYFMAIMSDLKQHTGSDRMQDDTTLIVVVFN